MSKFEKYDPVTGVLIMDNLGREVPDPTPIAVPAGFRPPETTEQMLARLIRRDREAQAELSAEETWEDLHDFDVGDDFDASTPYELFYDPVLGKEVNADEFRKNEARYRQEVLERQANYYRLREAEHLAMEAEKPEAAKGAAPSSKRSSKAPSPADDDAE